MTSPDPARQAATVQPGPMPGISTRVARGSIWTLSGQTATVLASLIATPFIIRLLGSESYGVLTLINVLVGYLAFTDFGMGTASTRYAADAHARGDDQGEVAVVWTSLLIALCPVAFCMALIALFAGHLTHSALQMPAHLQEESALALRLAGLGFIARVAASILNTPQLVRLRMDLNALVTSGGGVAQFFLVAALLFSGGGLVAAVSAMTVVAIATALVHLLVSKRLQPRLAQPAINMTIARSLVRFGGGLVISNLVMMILINVEKLFLARFASVTALAHYSVAFSLAGLLAFVPQAMNQSLLPAFSRLQSQPEREQLRRLYTYALRGNLLWIGPAALLLCAGAKPFFTFWAGAEYGRESTMPFYILVGGILFNVMAYIPYTLLMSYGRSNLIARFYIIELVPYIVCAAVLTKWFGAVGAAAAYSLRIIFDALLLSVAARRVSGFAFSPVAGKLTFYLVAVVMLVLPVLLISSLLDSQVMLIASALISLLVYSAVIWKLVLTNEERAWVTNLCRWPLNAGKSA